MDDIDKFKMLDTRIKLFIKLFIYQFTINFMVHELSPIRIYAYPEYDCRWKNFIKYVHINLYHWIKYI